MVLRGWREAMMAPTTEKVSSVTRLATTLLSPDSPPNGRSETVELAARDNANPPTSSAMDSAASDQASKAARRSILPTPRSRTIAPSVTTHPIYSTTVSQALRQALRARHSGKHSGKISEYLESNLLTGQFPYGLQGS
jgi:hypothetical protein